jgi:transcription elongation factor Elf1
LSYSPQNPQKDYIVGMRVAEDLNGSSQPETAPSYVGIAAIDFHLMLIPSSSLSIKATRYSPSPPVVVRRFLRATMGKRKSRKAPPSKKVAQKVATAFDCPFCGHSGSVECSIDLKDRVAKAECGVCMAVYATIANALTEPVDVYSEWIDECEKANEGVDAEESRQRGRRRRRRLT